MSTYKLTRTLQDALTHPNNTLSQLILREVDSFIINAKSSLLPSTSLSSEDYFIGEDGGTLVPVDSNMKAYADLVTNRITPKHFCNYRLLFDNVTHRIITLQNRMTYTDAILEIEKYRRKAGNHFYGALIRDGSKIINPYHVLTPMSYLKAPDVFKGTFKVYIFFYKDLNKAIEDTNAVFDSESELYIQEQLNSIIKCTSHKVALNTVSTNQSLLSMDINNGSTDDFQAFDPRVSTSHLSALSVLDLQLLNIKQEDTVNYPLLNHISSAVNSTNGKKLLIATQVMSTGIVAPEYSVSLLNLGTSLSGTFLTPSVSANISTATISNSLTFSSVCTGRESQITYKGISSLHHSNYSSAFNPSGHSEYSILLARESVLKSVQIYERLGLVPTDPSSLPISDEELAHFNTSFESFATYMITKHNFDLPSIENRYNQLKDKHGKETIE